jgi:hypothetical protein
MMGINPYIYKTHIIPSRNYIYNLNKKFTIYNNTARRFAQTRNERLVSQDNDNNDNDDNDDDNDDNNNIDIFLKSYKNP